MQYKPIKNCHVENAILAKDFNLGAIDFLFHVFTHLWVVTMARVQIPWPFTTKMVCNKSRFGE